MAFVFAALCLRLTVLTTSENEQCDCLSLSGLVDPPPGAWLPQPPISKQKYNISKWTCKGPPHLLHYRTSVLVPSICQSAFAIRFLKRLPYPNW